MITHLRLYVPAASISAISSRRRSEKVLRRPSWAQARKRSAESAARNDTLAPNVQNSEPIVGQPAHFPNISRYLVVSANWGFNFETTIYREMKEEDGELYTVMLFAAKGYPNRCPMWASGSFSGGCDWYANSIYTHKDGKNVLISWVIEDNNFTAGQPQGWGGMLSVPCKCKTSKTLSVKPLSDLQLLRNDNAHEQVASVSVKGSSQMLNSTGASFELIAELLEFFERGSKVGFEVCRSSVGDKVSNPATE
ncbi:hypothetical protein PF007_g27576 [Phytophthora fragariae]|uniref:Uncharacterized protein n=2 Tax=Phytophthora fragariae TaxID=53985 RepID=A0A6A3Q4W7_9STRA|nr:hypothetical protein PF007_g27576 [Phytophthora fragariae]